MGFFAKGLTLYHTIPTFNDPEEETFGKHCGKRRRMLVTSFFSSSHNGFSPYRNISIFESCLFCRLQMLSILDCAEILLFGKEFYMGFFAKVLTLYHTLRTFNDPEEETFGKHCGKRRRNTFQFLSHVYFAVCKCFQFWTVLKFCCLAKSFTWAFLPKG